MFHSQLKETRRILTAMATTKEQRADVEAALNAFLTDLDIFLERFRSLRPLFLDPRLAEESRVALNWADEMISLTVEKTLLRLVGLLAEFATQHARILARLEQETRYRQAHHYPMDDPVNELRRLHGGILDTVRARRVYHLTLIVGLSEIGVDSTPPTS